MKRISSAVLKDIAGLRVRGLEPGQIAREIGAHIETIKIAIEYLDRKASPEELKQAYWPADPPSSSVDPLSDTRPVRPQKGEWDHRDPRELALEERRAIAEEHWREAQRRVPPLTRSTGDIKASMEFLSQFDPKAGRHNS
ncbi:hypothetical protein ABGB18_21065 [Nonomuraea sp. B12E4]|uniref:hypothetical protein n=1 Tax=Nonomuraea sp. B12E4 TaxID=3153564 RepID=UPI00325D9EB5